MILITTTDVSLITRAIEEMLIDWPAINDASATVTRADERNGDPNLCPWIGIYRNGVEYGSEARVIGLGVGMRRQRVQIAIVVQAADSVSGADCELRLEAVLQAVTSALLSDVSLRGTVEVIEELNVQYESYEKVGASFFQEAVVFITASVVTGANNV